MGVTVITATNDGGGTERIRSANHAVGTVSRAISNGAGTDIIRSTIHADANGNEIRYCWKSWLTQKARSASVWPQSKSASCVDRVMVLFLSIVAGNICCASCRNAYQTLSKSCDAKVITFVMKRVSKMELY